MCGICAMSRAAGTSSIPDARRLARHAALAIEKRGPDATGFGWADEEGHPWYWKHKGSASRVAHRAPLPVGMRTYIGHTRWATKGSPERAVNNHPVVAPGLVLVHNGVLRNDDELFKALGVERVGEVDSEALAALLAHGPAVLGAEHPTHLLELVRGDYAIAWLDASEPHVLHLARGVGRPMHLGWTRRGDLLMSSTKATLEEAARRAGLYLARTEGVPEGTYIRVECGWPVERRRFKVPARPTPPPTPGKRGNPRKPGAQSALGRGRDERARAREIVERTTHDGLRETAPSWRVLADDRERGKWRYSVADQAWVPR